MLVASQVGLERRACRLRAGTGPEEIAAHVVVDADHVQAPAAEEPRGRGADEARRSGDKGNAHGRSNAMPADLIEAPESGQFCFANGPVGAENRVIIRRWT